MARWIRPETRARIVRRDDCTCAYCGRTGLLVGATADGARQAEGAATLDHVVPRAAGGDNRPSNLVCACGRCNSRRQDQPLRAWALVVGTERAEGAVAEDVQDRPAVVAQRLADEIVARVRRQTRRALPAAA